MNQQLSTHVLNLSTGKPSKGVVIKLFLLKESDSWEQFGEEGVTDQNGRFKNFKEINVHGTYKMRFETKRYFDELGITETLYPFIEITFDISSSEHYHIPLLLSPFGYSTYRGS